MKSHTAAVVALIGCLTVTACSSSSQTNTPQSTPAKPVVLSVNEPTLIGKWSDNKGMTYEFAPDHTGVVTSNGKGMSFTWSMAPDDTVKIDSAGNFITVPLKDGKLKFGAKTFSKVP